MRNRLPQSRSRLSIPPTALRLYGIVPLLDKSMKRLWTLAHEESERPFDRQEYRQVNEMFNGELLNARPARTADALPPANSSEDAISERHLPDSRSQTIPELVQGLQKASAYVDSSGYGLKASREGDAKFQSMMTKLDAYRCLPMDTGLKALIQCHTEFAEYSANMILAFRRGLRTTSCEHMGMGNSIRHQLRTELEVTESQMRKAGQAIRGEIIRHIRQIKPQNKDN